MKSITCDRVPARGRRAAGQVRRWRELRVAEYAEQLALVEALRAEVMCWGIGAGVGGDLIDIDDLYGLCHGVCVFVYPCPCPCLSVAVCVYVSIFLCVFICLYFCVCVFVCVCRCVYVSWSVSVFR